MRIFDFACLGDSLTSGWSQDVGLRRWKNDVADLLSVGASVPCVAYDVGSGGATSEWFVSNAARAAALRPAATLIAFGMNDAGTSSGITTAQFKANILDGIGILRGLAPETRLFVMTMNPTIEEGATTNPNPDAYYQKLREIAAEDDAIGLIDNFPLWGTPTSIEFPLSGVHPSLEAMRSIAVPNIVSSLRSFVP